MPDLLAVLWERLLREFAQSSPIDLFIKLAAAIVVTCLIYIAQKILRAIAAWIKRTLGPWWDCSRKIGRARRAVKESGPGLWLAIDHLPHPPAVKQLKGTGKLILTVANLKGGVGKTTLTANMAAYFANPYNDPHRPTRKVLVKFYGRLPKGTSRAKALARIRERHEKLMGFKRQTSTAGRSAA